jgi:hypothetical protein
MIEHSPTPWRVEGRSVMAGMAERIAEVGYSERATANAEFIVRAANAHEELLATVKLYVEFIGNTGHNLPREAAQMLYAKANAIITKAETKA